MLRVEVDFKIYTHCEEVVKTGVFHVSNDLKKCYLNYFIKGWVFDYIKSSYDFCDKLFSFDILKITKIKENF